MIGKLISSIKKVRQKQHLAAVDRYIVNKGSFLRDSFRLVLNKPQSGKKYLTVGIDTMLNCTVTFETDSGEIIIGDKSYVGESMIICKSRVEIADYVFIAWGCWIYDHDSHSIDYRERENDIEQQLNDFKAGRNFIENKNWSVVNSKPIKICSNAWIGMNCIILKGVTIGEGAIVGAGSVVTKDVAPWTVVGGNPAQFIKEIPAYLRKG